MSRRRRRKKTFRRLLFWLLCLAAVAAGVLLYSNGYIETDEYDVKLSGLPAGFEGYHIVQLSDIHGGDLLGRGGERLIRAVKEAKPDLIALTGDLVDREHPPESVRELLEGLAALAPVYYVTGNHEWAAKAVPELMRVLEETGVTALRGEFVPLSAAGGELILAGLDDRAGRADQTTAAELMEQIRAAAPEAPIVLLSHRPDEAETYDALGYDLILAGHVHGGMLRLPFLGGLVAPSRQLFPPYSKGLYVLEGGAQLLMSAGLAPGAGYPRVFNPLHIPVAVLHAA